MTNVERDKISEKDLCARDRVARYARVRVCSSNRDTCLLTAGNHFLQRRNSQIYNAPSLIRENTIGPVRRKFAEKRIERESNSTKRQFKKIRRKSRWNNFNIDVFDHSFARNHFLHVKIKLEKKIHKEKIMSTIYRIRKKR